jgi:hypothetical protein
MIAAAILSLALGLGFLYAVFHFLSAVIAMILLLLGLFAIHAAFVYRK